MTYSVGALIRAREREWVVLPDSDDEMLMVRPLGGTEEEATGLLLSIEGADIQPAAFPPPDPSRIGDFRSGRLLRDALRLGFRASAGPFRCLGRIAVTPRPYQLVPLLMALKLDPVRMLIADDVGVGKTIEALLIAREMFDQGDIRRLAVLCSPQLAEQWQREMSTKFHIPAVTVLSSTAHRLERDLAFNESLFDRHPFVVVSTDFIKSERRRDDFLRTCPEFVIVDEAHTAVDSSGSVRSRQQRHELLKGLARDDRRHLLLVTATPHSGKEEPFRALLTLLDSDFANLPDDLSGPGNAPHRRRLAAHLVQRRRADVRRYLGEDTTFPDRERADESYHLTESYRTLFDRALNLARETILDEEGGRHRQRVRWWSALALLRSIASSPAAAADTLRNRAGAAETGSIEEADEFGRRAVLDQGEDEATDAVDVTPGSDFTHLSDEDARYRRRLLELAREAEALPAGDDAKLQKAVKMVRALLRDGFNPILFCRFIPTADYLAAGLRAELPRDVVVEAVTGSLPPEEREARVEALGAAGEQRVLVATDCLAEGVNLQHYFNAVVHYDLSWNPTKHEQREGRCDRYGQPSKTVRVITYYGSDNRIDGIVLEVLLRKHEAIRKATGVSVPVPAGSDSLVEALMEGLLLRGRDPEQLQFEPMVAAKRDELFARWERAADHEKRSRSMFAQEAIKVDEVRAEVEAAQRAVGTRHDVERFVQEAVAGYGGRVADAGDGRARIDLAETPRSVREAVGWQEPFLARFDEPVKAGEVFLSRPHPFVGGLATHVLDEALDMGRGGTLAARCGAARTSGVSKRTTLLLVRFRFNLVASRLEGTEALLAEDAGILGFTGAPEVAEWLDADTVAVLLDARPDANVEAGQAAEFVGKALEGLVSLAPQLESEAGRLASQLQDQHRRVRRAAQQRGVRFTVTPHLPPDLLGVFVLLPHGSL